MSTVMEPVEGNWYESLESGDLFFVVTVDEEEGIIEVQHRDGATEEIELGSWQELDIEPVDPPDDFQGRLDDLDDGEDEESLYEREELDDDATWGDPERDADG